MARLTNHRFTGCMNILFYLVVTAALLAFTYSLITDPGLLRGIQND